MGKFGLMRGAEGRNGAGKKGKATAEAPLDAQTETLEVLLQLQYKREEAREMIRKAFSRKPGLSNAEEILNEVYRQRKETK